MKTVAVEDRKCLIAHVDVVGSSSNQVSSVAAVEEAVVDIDDRM